jgi:hypothetical protein
MRHALGVLGVLAAGVLLAVSAAMNWQFGYNLGRTPFDGQIYGAASAAADCMKALVPFFFFAAWRNKMWSQAAASALVWGVVTVYSLTSALGHAALNRADTTGTRSAQSLNYSDIRADVKRAQDQLGWIPQHRPAATVQAEIEGLKAHRAYGWSNACTKLDGKAERTLCDKLHSAEAELGSGLQASVLEKRISEAQAKLAGQSAHTGASEGDPQAAVLASLLGNVAPGLKVSDVQTMMTVFVALLLEVGSGLGMYVAFSQWRLYDVQAPSAPRFMPVVQAATINTAAVAVAAQPAVQQIAKPRSGANDNRTAPAATTTATTVSNVTRLLAPENDVERFYKESIEVTDGSSLTATELYEDYCAWCETKTKEPLALPTFGRAFGELGVKKEKIAGRIRYIGIALKSDQDRQGDAKPPVFASQAA